MNEGTYRKAMHVNEALSSTSIEGIIQWLINNPFGNPKVLSLTLCKNKDENFVIGRCRLHSNALRYKGAQVLSNTRVSRGLNKSKRIEERTLSEDTERKLDD